jgi:hypothetical protein
MIQIGYQIKYKQTFIEGLSKRDQWATDIRKPGNAFIKALFFKTRDQFQFSKVIKIGLQELVEEAKKNLNIA